MTWPTYECKRCGERQQQHPAAQVWHRCPKTNSAQELKRLPPEPTSKGDHP